MVELSASDEELGGAFKRKINGLLAIYEQLIERARDEGEVGKAVDPTTLAHYLATAQCGLLVLSKVVREKKALQAVVDEILSHLETV